MVNGAAIPRTLGHDLSQSPPMPLTADDQACAFPARKPLLGLHWKGPQHWPTHSPSPWFVVVVLVAVAVAVAVAVVVVVVPVLVLVVLAAHRIFAFL